MTTTRPKVLIAGSGSAGLFCAWALADRADVTVIEAGPDPGTPVPAHYLYDGKFPECDWGYRDADTGQALLAGRVVGGTSTINTTGILRGEPADYDAWGPNWAWADCLRAFCAIEADQEFGAAPYHGDAGPIPITRASRTPFEDAFIEVCREAGYPEAPDHNAPGARGVGPWPTNSRDGARIGTLAGVMPQLRGRIDLRADTVVERVAVESGRAVGLKVRAGQQVETLRADHTVLACGAFGTPLLLHRSGLQVPGLGAHLQNHSEAWFSVRCREQEWIDRMPLLGSLLRAGLDGNAADLFNFYALPAARVLPGFGPSDLLVQASMLAPRSMGEISWSDGTPAIRQRHFSNPEDLPRLARMVALAADLVNRMAERGLVEPSTGAWWQEPNPEAALRGLVQYEFHAAGTCGIGRVVDERLRVRGVEGLSIADASVMPRIPQANVNMPTMMVGVRAGWMRSEEL